MTTVPMTGSSGCGRRRLGAGLHGGLLGDRRGREQDGGRGPRQRPGER